MIAYNRSWNGLLKSLASIRFRRNRASQLNANEIYHIFKILWIRNMMLLSNIFLYTDINHQLHVTQHITSLSLRFQK